MYGCLGLCLGLGCWTAAAYCHRVLCPVDADILCECCFFVVVGAWRLVFFQHTLDCAGVAGRGVLLPLVHAGNFATSPLCLFMRWLAQRH
jgi:hypothetical protein